MNRPYVRHVYYNSSERALPAEALTKLACALASFGGAKEEVVRSGLEPISGKQLQRFRERGLLRPGGRFRKLELLQKFRYD